jgi:hypothetical protein
MDCRLRGNDGLGAGGFTTVDPAEAGSYAELESSERKKATRMKPWIFDMCGECAHSPPPRGFFLARRLAPAGEEQESFDSIRQ